MPLAEQLVRQRYVRSGPLVLGTAPIKYPAPTTDRDRTVSRRSEPSSRTALMGEQPNPWDLLQLNLECFKPEAKPLCHVVKNGSEYSLLCVRFNLVNQRGEFIAHVPTPCISACK